MTLPVLELRSDGMVDIPAHFAGDLTITTPWRKVMRQGENEKLFFRYPERGDKPYIQHGLIQFKQRGRPPQTFQLIQKTPRNIVPKRRGASW
jgi:hypothetical protein